MDFIKIFILNAAQKILKISKIIGGAALLVLAVSAAMQIAGANSRLCLACHIVQPEYLTWKASSHSKVTCVKCHEEPGVLGYFTGNAKMIKNLALYTSGQYKMPLVQKKPIQDESCLECHSFYRKLSPAGDLIVPHKTHYDRKITCTTCHSGVAHGQLASLGLNTKANLSSFTKTTAQAVMGDKVRLTVSMNTCMKCHDQKGGPLDCEACHSTSKYPEYHRQKTFTAQHGEWARKQLKACDLCHGYYWFNDKEKQAKTPIINPAKSSALSKIEAAALYPKQNSFCRDCHSKLPESHKKTKWNETHGEGKDPSRCLACHEEQKFCNSCHSKLPFTHQTKEFKNNHGAGQKTTNCRACHANAPAQKAPARTICSTCHVSNPHKEYSRQMVDHNFHNRKQQGDCMGCHDTCTVCHQQGGRGEPGAMCLPCHR